MNLKTNDVTKLFCDCNEPDRLGKFHRKPKCHLGQRFQSKFQKVHSYKQVKDTVESILNIRKKQHSEDEENFSILPDIIESVKALTQTCFNIVIENENPINMGSI